MRNTSILFSLVFFHFKITPVMDFWVKVIECEANAEQGVCLYPWPEAAFCSVSPSVPF